MYNHRRPLTCWHCSYSSVLHLSTSRSLSEAGRPFSRSPLMLSQFFTIKYCKEGRRCKSEGSI
uniref:Uncharacterized protein n=1 Tax=Arundo donax TaxID=35708 RepID=A0A0A9AUQ0_ARUDO